MADSVLALSNAKKKKKKKKLEKKLNKALLPVKRLHISSITYSVYFVLVPTAF